MFTDKEKFIIYTKYPRNRSVRVRKLRKLTSTLHLPELMIFDISFISSIITSYYLSDLAAFSCSGYSLQFTFIAQTPEI